MGAYDRSSMRLSVVLLVVAQLIACTASQSCGPGCFRAGSVMAGGRRSEASCEAGDLCGLNVTGKADLISLDLSDMFVVECPWYDHDDRGHFTLGSSTPINPEMFVSRPFIVGGMRWSCLGEDEKIDPFYLRVKNQTSPQFSEDGLTVRLVVRKADLLELFYGKAHIETDMPLPDRGGGRRSAVTPPQGSAAAVTLPPAGCKYSYECKSLLGITWSSGCPDGYQYVNPLSLSRKWNKAAAHSQGIVSTGDSTVVNGDEMQCDENEYRYHCCNDKKFSFAYDLTAYEYNMNYDTSTQTRVEEKTLAGGAILCTNCYSYVNVKAVLEVDVTATTVDFTLDGLDNMMIPSGVSKLEAYIEGAADFRMEYTVSSDSALQLTLGPYDIVPENREMVTVQFMLGYIAVKMDFGLRFQATLTATLAYTLPAPLYGSARAQGSIKIGGTYDNGAFTTINTKSLTTSFVAPSLAKALNDLSATGDVRLTLTPTVYVTFYDLLKTDFMLNMYGGVDLIKYAAGDTSSTRQCTGTGPDLHYSLYYGLDFQLRVLRPQIPDAFSISASCPSDYPCVGGLPFRCLTQDYYGGVITGSTILAENEAACGAQSGSLCTCSQYSTATANAMAAYSSKDSDIYWLKYPQTGLFTVLEKTAIPKSICSKCSGCIDLSALINALAKFEVAISELVGTKLTDFIDTFKTNMVTKINAAVDASLQILDTSMIKNVVICRVADLSGGACPSTRRRDADAMQKIPPWSILWGSTSRRSTEEVQIDYTIEPTEGYDARDYEQAAQSVAQESIGVAISASGVTGAIAPTIAPTSAPTSAPTNSPTVAATVVSQVVTFQNLVASSYTGTTKTNYEKGYGKAIGACSGSCDSYNNGISIGSSATAARRAASVTFQTTLTGLTDTSAYSSGCSGSCTTTTLANQIATTTGTSVTVTSMTTGTSTTTATSSGGGGGGGSSVGMIIGIVVALVVVAGAVAAGVFWYMHKKKQSQQSTVIPADSKQETKITTVAPADSKQETKIITVTPAGSQAKDALQGSPTKAAGIEGNVEEVNLD